ncbi:AAA family ATPase [Solirubrobacter sp. CPCC 204708]|uniref:AAA family ATPase n=1 Tax=Solirubrobacter deserti TaxID=2282478 RepID=A0ABT4RBQ2_9ACTN|nr:AAA family ATPase [Solirubrobacter deserti]MBE2317144.1 AAA family ATPase [Solirubrobacter deserti]MDA0135963.1 AAA family ATPase [Solirubrobacter deserti]
MSDGWSIHLCGELRVELAGERREAQLRGHQGRMLFAYLVLHRDRVVHRDELVEALWTDDAAPPSKSALAPVLSRVRRAIAPATIEGRETVRLQFPVPVWIDVEAALVAAPREALALTEERLLPQYDAPWLRSPREALEEARVRALEALARAGDEQAGRAAVALSPFRESAYAALIEALLVRGNRAEGLRRYDELRVRLREELGTTPGPELRTLHERLLARPTAAPATRPAGLVEREGELAAIGDALGRLAAGLGGVLAIEGPAGIGKTRLLTATRERALAAGATVLDARAGVLEREYGFGVVRQLFEAVAAGDPPPAPAHAVFGGEGVAHGQSVFAVLAALFQYTAGLATRGPLVLCVDDLQWSDTASLRFVAYLARRITSLPVLVVAAIRTGEPDVDELLLAEVEQDPATVAIRPRPLSAKGTADLVADVLGGADAAVAAACLEVTGGNPLLLRELLTALAGEPGTPDVASVRAIGPRAVSKTVRLRLARLPWGAGDVARAIATLGEHPHVGEVAALAGTGEDTAAEGIAALTRAEILRGDGPLGFVHPLVRDAVYLEFPAARRELEHARAARLLAELGAAPERVAAQLMLAAPRGDAWVVERLREAARIAVERGAPEAALALLQRAVAEMPTPDGCAELMLELGAAAEFVRGEPAADALREAHATLTDPRERALAALLLARTLLFMEHPAEAVTVVDAARAELGAEQADLDLALRAIRIVGVFFGVADQASLAELGAWRAGPRTHGPGAKTLTSATALAVALLLGDAQEAVALARESLAGDEMPLFDRGIFTVQAATVLALHEPASAEPVWQRIRALSARRGSVLDAIGVDLWGGFAALWTGDLPRAIELLERAIEGESLFGSAGNAHMAYSSALLALAWHERGERDRAWAALRHVGEGRSGPSDGERFWMISHAELLLADGQTAQARSIAHALAATRPAELHPLWGPWRGLLARAAAAEGDRQTASRLAAEELALARRRAAPWVVGRSLRQLGEVTGDQDALHEAVRMLDGTSARLERAKAYAALGRRERALDLARACGADALASWLEATAGRGGPGK